jgi:hypothetical protein
MPRERTVDAAEHALVTALNRALAPLEDHLWDRDIAQAMGDMRRREALARQIRELLARLDSMRMLDALGKPLLSAYSAGWQRTAEGSQADQQTAWNEQGVVQPALDTDALRALASTLVNPLKTRLENAASPVRYVASRVLDETERTRMIEIMIEARARGMTTKQIKNELLSRGLLTRLITQDLERGDTVEIKTKGGGRFTLGLDNYVTMLARTTSYWASNHGAMDRAESAGAGLVIVTTNPDTEDWCADLEGRVYALNDEAASTWNVPLLADTPNGGPPFHPNCRHTISGYFPSEKDKGNLPVATDDELEALAK